MPHFVRVAWVSDQAKEVWSIRLNKICTALQDVQWRSVVEGLRPCAAMPVTADQLVEIGRKCADFGLSVLPLQVRCTSAYYSGTNETPLFDVVIGKLQNAKRFRLALESLCDPGAVGRLLGSPLCCRQAAYGLIAERRLDPTWRTVQATTCNRQKLIILDNKGLINIIWSPLGLQNIPWIPCNLKCTASLKLARRYMQIGSKSGSKQEMQWLREILSWPVEWTALHGIAEIKTPILKISASTDPTPGKLAVQLTSDSYPAEGAVGLNFPFRSSGYPSFTNSKSQRLALTVLSTL
jgi:hypothetical protein